MPNYVFLFLSRLPSPEKDLNLHSQTLAASSADAATWFVAHVIRTCWSLIQHEPNLGRRTGSGKGKDKPTLRCCSP